MNFISKHWRGELSLGKSFWLNLVLINILFIELPVFYISQHNYHPQTLFKLLSFFIIFCLILLPWQVIGLWRSSERHVLTTGKRFWPSAAKVWIIISLLRTLCEIGPEMLILSKSFQLGFTKDKFANYQISVEDNGELLHISGGFGFGIYDDINKYFEKENKIKGIVFNSEGGRIYEARKLSELIINKKLNTYVLKNCQSACTIAFISGERRYIGKNATLGFHAYTDAFEGLQINNISMEDEQKNDLKLFRKQGVSEEFLIKQYHADNKDMWYPAINELLKNNVIHGLVNCSDIKIKNCSESLELEKENLIREYPFFEAINKYDPKLYSAIFLEFEKRLEKGTTLKEFQLFVLELLTPLITYYLDKTSNEATIKYAQSTIFLLKKLKSIDPVLCLKSLHPSELGPIDLTLYLSKDEMRERMNILSMIIIDSYEKDNPPYDKLVTQNSFEVLARDFFANTDMYEVAKLKTKQDFNRACDCEINFISRVLEEDQETAANIIKLFYTTTDES